MTSLADITREQAYSINAGACHQYVGQQFRIDHLTSEKGRTLFNGKMCRVVGFTSSYAKNPEMRLQCKIINDDGSESKPVLLKGYNLVPTNATIMQELMPASKPLSDKEIKKGLKQALSAHPFKPNFRKDLLHRLVLYKNVLKKLENTSKKSSGNALDDEDYCFPCMAAPPPTENEEVAGWIMRVGRPACVGNNKLDLRYMDLGLKGDDVATCGICTEKLCKDDLVTLPCVHQFHFSCLEKWLSSDLGRVNWSCPTCRAQVPNDLGTYKVKYATELRNRFQEFPLSGFCHKCILWFMEKDRNMQPQGMMNENGPMTMNQVGQMSEQVFMYAPGMNDF